MKLNPFSHSHLTTINLIIILTVSCASCAPVQTLAPTAEFVSTSVPAPLTPTITASDSPTNIPTILGTFDVGGGRSLFLKCQGSASPTIILEAGDEASSSTWGYDFQLQLANNTRTCAYDRAGLGQSDPASGCRELPELVSDLENLLNAAHVTGPYIMTATSGGGYIAAGFAVRHKEEIAGIILIDVSSPFVNPPPELVDDIRCDNPSNVERRNYLQVEEQAWSAREQIGNIPVTIISVDYGANAEPGNVNEQENVEQQKGWFVLSPLAIQVVVNTGHVVYKDDPDLVISEIIKVVKASRKG